MALTLALLTTVTVSATFASFRPFAMVFAFTLRPSVSFLWRTLLILAFSIASRPFITLTALALAMLTTLFFITITTTLTTFSGLNWSCLIDFNMIRKNHNAAKAILRSRVVNFNLDAEDTLFKRDVADSAVNEVLTWLTSRDDNTLLVFLSVSTLLT